MMRVWSRMLGTYAVLSGDGAQKVNTTLAASHFSRDDLPQTQSELLVRAHFIILEDCSHINFDAASVFNVSIPASSQALFNAG